MVNFYRDSNEIKETDIIFDCPNCAKSLAIDYRGAGLSIPCTDCGQYVDVPIPEGMEVTDIDSSDEEQEIRILNLRKSLAAAEGRISELEAKIEQLQANTAAVQAGATDGRLTAVGAQAEALRKLLLEATAVLARLDTSARGDEDASASST